jgi:CheY-like chemotaxis protein
MQKYGAWKMYKPEDNEIIRRIIVIDDNPDIHGDFKAIFTAKELDTTEVNQLEAQILGVKTDDHKIIKDNYELDYAFQGEEGVEKIRQAVADGRPYELAFVDMRMPPGWDGLETIERIWQIDSHVQIVICTAFSDYTWEEIISKLGHKGSLLLLKKPFDNAEISQLACALTEKYMLCKQISSGDENLYELIKRKSCELEIARASADVAEKIIKDIMTDDNLSEEQKDLINAICKNCGELLNTIKRILEASKFPSGQAG